MPAGSIRSSEPYWKCAGEPPSTELSFFNSEGGGCAGGIGCELLSLGDVSGTDESPAPVALTDSRHDPDRRTEDVTDTLDSTLLSFSAMSSSSTSKTRDDWRVVRLGSQPDEREEAWLLSNALVALESRFINTS